MVSHQTECGTAAGLQAKHHRSHATVTRKSASSSPAVHCCSGTDWRPRRQPGEEKIHCTLFLCANQKYIDLCAGGRVENTLSQIVFSIYFFLKCSLTPPPKKKCVGYSAMQGLMTSGLEWDCRCLATWSASGVWCVTSVSRKVTSCLSKIRLDWIRFSFSLHTCHSAEQQALQVEAEVCRGPDQDL